MDKKLVSFLILLSTFYFSYSQNQSVEYAKQGMKLFDEGKYNEAIEQYKKGKQIDQKNSLFSYEIALSYFMLKDYQACILTLDSVMDRPDANEQFYQLLGDSYDMTGKSDTALIIYKKGMQKFPRAASLSMESGVVEYTRKKYDSAHDFWVMGISMNPGFADNYYHLARFYADSSNRIPAILFSEIYLNLVRNTAQAAEISKLICNLYGQSIQMLTDSTIVLHFYDKKENPTGNIENKDNFCSTLNNSFQIVSDALKGKKTKPGIDAVINVRETFIKTWFDQKNNLEFPLSLFDFEKQLMDAGHFKTYSQWLFMKCDRVEFQKWYNENTKVYNDFVEWYKKHSFTNSAMQEVNSCR